jgi:peptide deformylase
MILDLVPGTDPILKEVMPEYDFVTQGALTIGLAQNLSETLMSQEGLGLAAPQVGLRHRAFVMLTNPIRVCFNPIIIDKGEEMIELDEGCLSFPGILIKVTRPRRIKVRYSLPNQEIKTEVFDGMTSRIFQHELDHLNGILFTDHVSKLKVDMAKRKARKKI